MDSWSHAGETIITLAVGSRSAVTVERDLCLYGPGPGAVLQSHRAGDHAVVWMQVRERTVPELVVQTDFPDRAPAVRGGEGVERSERGNQFGGVGKSSSVANGLQDRCVLLGQE